MAERAGMTTGAHEPLGEAAEPIVRIFEDLGALSRGAADLFVQQVLRAIRARGACRVALSGGTTPRRTYEILASRPYRERVPWAAIHVFYGDERCVPPADRQSNGRMTREALLTHVPIPPENVHPIRGDAVPSEAARLYEADLRRHFAGEPPRFDLVLLGMGEDGHTASLFSGSPAVEEKERWVTAVQRAEETLSRVTLTLPVLNQGRCVCFLVTGGNKAGRLFEVLLGTPRLPAGHVRPERGELLWYVDRSAATGLRRGGPFAVVAGESSRL